MTACTCKPKLTCGTDHEPGCPFFTPEVVMCDLTREKLDRLAIHGGGSVALGCADHPDGGTNVIYQDGVVRVLCRACGFECARVKAAASTQPPSPQAEVQDCQRCKGAGTIDGDTYRPGEKVSHFSDRGFLCPDCNGTGKQSPAELQGDVVEHGSANELLAECLFRFAAIRDGSAKRWPDLHESDRNSWREDARLHLAKVTPLIHLEVKERLLSEPAQRAAEAALQEAERLPTTNAAVTALAVVTAALDAPVSSEPEEGK